MTAPLIQPWMYLIAAPLALLGLVGLYCSLFKGRAKGRQRCPKCWYSLAGATAPTTCPECGHTVRTREDLLRTRRHWRSAILSIVLIAPLLFITAKLHGRTIYYAIMPKWQAVEEVEWNGTTITRFHIRNPDAPAAERILVRAGGNHVLDREDRSISITGYSHDHEPLIDLDNDDIKECVIESYSGGAHCCYRVFIVKLLAWGPEIVADIDARNGMAVTVPQKPGEVWLFDIPDQTFDYWRAPHAQSPMPRVLYRLDDGALRSAVEHMDALMTVSQADALARESAVTDAQNAPGGVAPFVWKTMLEMLYAGHEQQAWAFFDRACTTDKDAKEKFREEFLRKLADDPWYQDIRDARAARAAGKPIPASRIGKSGAQSDAAK